MSQETRVAKLLAENAMLREIVRWRPTHRHVKSGGLYRVTCEDRLEVTKDDAVRLVDYENEAGMKFAQSYGRFHDGRFVPTSGSLQDFSEEDLLRVLLTRGKVNPAPHNVGTGGLYLVCIGVGENYRADILINREAYENLRGTQHAF